MRRFKITSLLVGVLALVFLTFGNANAKAPEPRPTFDNVTITAALHAGGFVNAWTQHIGLNKYMVSILRSLVFQLTNYLISQF